MKKINLIIIISTIVFSCLYLILNINILNLSQILVIISIIPILFLIRIIRKFFNIKIGDGTEFIYILFIIFAQLIGSVFKVYDLISNYDNIIHYSSGLLTSVFAINILNNTKLQNRTILTDIVFIIFSTLSVATFWEFFEFTSDKLLGGDAQRVLESGVTDTMTDMFCAFFGSLLFSLIYYFKKTCK